MPGFLSFSGILHHFVLTKLATMLMVRLALKVRPEGDQYGNQTTDKRGTIFLNKKLRIIISSLKCHIMPYSSLRKLAHMFRGGLKSGQRVRDSS